MEMSSGSVHTSAQGSESYLNKNGNNIIISGIGLIVVLDLLYLLKHSYMFVLNGDSIAAFMGIIVMPAITIAWVWAQNKQKWGLWLGISILFAFLTVTLIGGIIGRQYSLLFANWVEADIMFASLFLVLGGIIWLYKRTTITF